MTNLRKKCLRILWFYSITLGDNLWNENIQHFVQVLIICLFILFFFKFRYVLLHYIMYLWCWVFLFFSHIFTSYWMFANLNVIYFHIIKCLNSFFIFLNFLFRFTVKSLHIKLRQIVRILQSSKFSFHKSYLRKYFICVMYIKISKTLRKFKL